MFVIAKILGALAQPANAALVMLLLGVALLHTRRWLWGRRLLGGLVAILLVVAVLPLDEWLLAPLEDRFPAPRDLPERVDGVVVLGGAVDPVVSAARGQPSLNGAVERVTALVELGRRYPDARLVFSGGSGSVTTQEHKEAPAARDFLAGLGFDVGRVVFEAQSRNTRENATLTRERMAPKPGETWLLVTSAMHMPRSVGTFRAVGWPVVPYPVDFVTTGRAGGLGLDLGRGLGALGAALHEGLGMVYYRMRGWTDRLYPGPHDLV